MEKYKYKVVLEVEVEAFDPDDAFDAIQDQFGIGNQQGVEITSCEVKITRGNRNR